MTASIFDGLPGIFTECLGEPVVYTPTGGSPVTINGIVIKQMADAVFENADAIANSVMVHVRTTDVPQLAEGDLFEVPLDGGTYIGSAQQSFRADGKGMTMVTLAKAS